MSGRWRIRHGDHRAGPRPRRLRAGAGPPAAPPAVLFAAAGRAQDLRDLTGSQGDQLARGAVLVTSRPVEGYPWPEVTVYRLVAASPEEVIAVYADFEGQARYLPNLVESRIVERPGRNVFRVVYEYEVSGPNERYRVRAAVERAGAGLRVGWQLITARSARRLSGHVAGHPPGAGALLAYTNRVDPGFFGVRLGSPESTAPRLQEIAQALARHVERLRAAEPETLHGLVRALQAMLGEP